MPWPKYLREAALCGEHLYLVVTCDRPRVQVLCAKRKGQELSGFRASETVLISATEALRGDYARRFDLAVLLRDGEVLLYRGGVAAEEHVREWQGKRKRSLWLGALRQLRQVEDELFALGEAGQIYVRQRDGGWKPMRPPEKDGRELHFTDVARDGEALLFCGYEVLNATALGALRETLSHLEFFRKLKERHAILWSYDGSWQERTLGEEAEMALAFQSTGTGPTVWLSSGVRVPVEPTRGGALLQVPAEWLHNITVVDDRAYFSAGSIQCVSAEGRVAAVSPDDKELRLLGASPERLLACDETDIYSSEADDGRWQRLGKNEEPSASLPLPLLLHPSYQDFLRVYPELYGQRGCVPHDELKAWPGVSSAGDGAGPAEDETPEYWLQDLAVLYGREEVERAALDESVWGAELLDKGYPIGVGFDGSPFIQSTKGDVYHVHGDEWIEDEDRQALAAMSVDEFFQEWGHHHLADEFRSFYRKLCEQREASTQGLELEV